MRTITIITLLLLRIPVNAQDTLAANPWQTGVSFSPDLAYRTLRDNGNTYHSRYIVDTRNSLEIPRPGFTAGFVATYDWRDRVYLTGGLCFSLKGFQTKKVEVSSLSSNIDSTNIRSIQFQDHFHYIELPVMVHCRITTRKLRLVAGAGVAGNLLVNQVNVTKTVLTDGRVKRYRDHSQSHDYNTLNVSVLLSAGVIFSLSEKIELRMEPTARCGIFQIIDRSVTTYLWNAGINLSAHYTL